MTTAPLLGTYYKEEEEEERRESNSNWNSTFSSWPPANEMRMLPNSEEFDMFNYDEGTFGNYAPELPGGYEAPLPPNYYRPIWKRSDRYSVPRPPPDRGRPDPLPQPVGTADAAAAFLNTFKGEADDLDRFFGDCMMYFEAHASYFLLPSHMIPFTTSLFDGPAKMWWVHQRLKYWAVSRHDLTPSRFRYPTWEEFVNTVNTQFRDPAVMEVQEKKMFDLWMGNGPATIYFQELEVIASKAGQ
ncbi:uncharacterized protein ARMOST_03160 [Armillaria ostoyae]|uniref:Retrotransposon gag domain-containing protein n=1 Tax=Armillaria ostoyae TaxID=47428 RepID=A0A284QTS8_ARMOS|nr:uncharacterized protein ARMOST_03160 [Armillaria ostoyae]